MLDVTFPGISAGTPQVGDNWSYGSGRLAKAVGQGQGLPSLSLTMTCPGASAFTLIDSDIQAKFYMDDQVTEWHEAFDGTVVSASESELGTLQISASPDMRKLDVTRTADITNSIGTKLKKFYLPEATDGANRCPAGAYIIDIAYVQGARRRVDVSAGDLLYVLAAAAIQDLGLLEAESYPQVIGSAFDATPFIYVMRPNGEMVDAWAIPWSPTPGVTASAHGITASGSSLGVPDQLRIAWKQPASVSSEIGIRSIATGGFLGGTTLSTSHGLIMGMDRWGTYTVAFRSGGAATPANQTRTYGPGLATATTDGLFRGCSTPFVPTSISAAGWQAWIYGSVSSSPNKWWFMRDSANPLVDLGLPSGGNVIESDSGYQFHLTDRTITALFEWGTGTNFTNNPPVAQFLTDEPINPFVSAVSNGGFLATVTASRTEIQLYMTLPTTFAAYVYWYAALADPDIRISIGADVVQVDDLFTVPAYDSWDGNVWAMLCDLSTASGNRIRATRMGFSITRPQATPLFPPDNTSLGPVELTSYTREGIQVLNRNTLYPIPAQESTDVWGTHLEYRRIYESAADDAREFQVNANRLTEFVVSIDSSILYVNPDDRQAVTGLSYALFDASTGEQISSQRSTMTFNIRGSGRTLRIGILSIPRPGYGTDTMTVIVKNLIVRGLAVTNEPDLMQITGDPDGSRAYTSPFFINARVSASSGVALAHAGAGASHGVTASFIGTAPGVAPMGVGLAGRTMRFGNANYIIDQYSVRGDTASASLSRHTLQGIGEPGDNPEAIWGGKTAGEFDSFWSSRDAIRYTLSPLDH